jgi:predicted DNA-binding protein YlxM (UPF0122 family)
VIFSKDFGLREISEHKEFEFKCVSVTLSKTTKSLNLFQNVLLKKLILILFPFSKESMMIYSP